MKNKKNVNKKTDEKTKETLNYNDRLDGYGFGEADKEDKHTENEKGIDDKDSKRYGEVDQYTFRDSPLGKGRQSKENGQKDTDSPP